MKFSTKSIEEVSNKLIDYRGKTPVKATNGIKLITAKVIKDGFIKSGKHEYISAESYDTWMRRGLPRQWDILITTEAPLGEVAQIRSTEKVALAQRVILLRGNPEIIDQQFYFQCLKSEFVQAGLKARSTGTTVFGIKQSELRQVQIPVPPLPTQHKVASILSAYDDMIENNLRRIKILEEMAQNLYREWFVKFRFPGHENTRFVDSPLGKIPEGWEIGTLGTISTIIPGYAFKSKDWSKTGIPVIKIKNIHPNNLIDTDQVDFVQEGILSQKHDKYWLHNGDILIAMTGATAGKVGKIRSKVSMLLNQRVAKFEPKQNYREFLWCTVCSPSAEKGFFALADGAAQPNMSGSQIENVELLLPKTNLISDFNEIVSPFIKGVDNMLLRNQILRQTRDLLLPKLISGEIDVSEMDIETQQDEVPA